MKLKAPKSQKNVFGNYNYRSCEDILEAVKPLLNGMCLTVSDKIVLVGDRYYVKATAKIMYGDAFVANSAYAREPLEKKGMDGSQITGASSSYARKYALNGLFAIDDTKDADSDEGEPKKGVEPTAKVATQAQRGKIFVLGGQLGYNEEKTKEMIVKFFKLANFAQLTLIQASTIIEKMEKKVSEKKQAEVDEEPIDIEAVNQDIG